MGIRGSKSSQIYLDDVRLPGDALLGEVGGGFKIAMSTLDGGRIGIAAQAIASRARRSRTRSPTPSSAARSASRSRSTSDRVQARRHGDRARRRALLALRAAWLKDHKHPYGKEAAMAKLYASDVANRAAREAIQIFGGNGYVTSSRSSVTSATPRSPRSTKAPARSSAW